MAWYPDAVRKQLTVPNRARNKVAMPAPRRINHHTAVSNASSLAWAGDIPPGKSGYRANFFNTTGAGGVFSHFYVTRDGVVEQMQDTAYRAACDLDGNADTISIETWDGYKTGYPGYWRTDTDVPPWTPEQVAAIAKLDAWILRTHPTIPAKLATDNRRAGTTSHGLSWHRLGVPGAPGYIPPESGGLRYTTSRGKVCPGDRRTAQVAAILQIIRAGTPTTTSPEEDDIMAMTPAERSALVDDIAQASTTKLLLAQLGASGPSVGVALQGTSQSVVALRGEIAGLTTALGQIATGHVDMEAISQAARDGARQALTDARITVDLGPDTSA